MIRNSSKRREEGFDKGLDRRRLIGKAREGRTDDGNFVGC